MKHVLTLVTALLVGCTNTDLTTALETAGLTDPPPPTAALVDLVVDCSAGSPGTDGALQETLDALLPSLGARPDSTLRLWMISGPEADIRLVTTVTTTPLQGHGHRATQATSRRWSATQRQLLLAATAPYLRRPARASPLFEALTMISLAGIHDQHHVVLLTDGRPVTSAVDWECNVPTDADQVVEELHREGLLLPDTLAGSRVTFAFSDLRAIDKNRCPNTPGDERRRRELWTAILERAGVTEITFELGAPMGGAL